MTIIDEPARIEIADPLLAEFAASRVGFDCPEAHWDDEISPFPLLEAALRAGGPTGRLVRLVVVEGRIVGAARIEALLGRSVPARILDAVTRLAASLGADAAHLGVDVVVDEAGHWWFGGVTELPRLAG